MNQQHVHDCTGPDLRCPCGFVFTIPPIYVSIEIFDGRTVLFDKSFNTNSRAAAMSALQAAIEKLKSGATEAP